jgi:hypothetical protein
MDCQLRCYAIARHNQETHLEEVLLVTQALFLLFPELVERIVMTVEVDQLVMGADGR